MERPHRGDLPKGHFVALAELRRRIPIELQDFRQRRLFLGPDAVVARSRRRHFGDRAHTDRMMVSTGEHRLTRRRAQSRRMEAVVLQAVGCEAFGGGRVARSAKRARGAEADVVEEHDQHVRRAFWRPQRHDRRVLRIGILGVVGRQPDMLRVRDRQYVARKLVVRISHGVRSLRVHIRVFSDCGILKTVLCHGSPRVETHVNNHSKAWSGTEQIVTSCRRQWWDSAR